MKQYTAIIRDMYGREWEEQHNVPDALDAEAAIRNEISIYNMRKSALHEFVKIKRARIDGRKIYSAKIIRTRKSDVL